MSALTFALGLALAGASPGAAADDDDPYANGIVSGGSPAGLVGLSLPATFRPFHPQSAWNRPIPRDPAIMPGSDAMMRRLAAKAGILKADAGRWSIPLFVVDAGQAPRRRVHFSKPGNPYLDPEDKGYVDGLPLPDGIWPVPSDDGHMLVVDAGRRVAWDFSRVRIGASGRIEASRIDVWDLDGMGERDPFSGRRWWSLGARGSGFPLLAGLVRPEEVRAGAVRHALVFAAPTTRDSIRPGGPRQLCPPASKSDGPAYGPDTIPMGARLQLDPALDLAALGLSPAARVIARAMQEYGLYAGDTTGDVFKIYLQNVGPQQAAWRALDIDLTSLAAIPIEAFRVLDCPLAEKQLPE